MKEETSLSRRTWLKNVALAGAATVLSSDLLAEEKVANNSKPAKYESPIRFAVSSYSYWHFEKVKYPIERVIENASKLGFDGVEILHRQMESEEIPYMNKLKRLAFDAGLALPMLSIHQSFVKPDIEARKKDIEHTRHCIRLAVQMGIPCIRMNTGSWGTGRSNPDYYKTGIETPLPGYTDEDAIKWCIDGLAECLIDAEKAGVILAIENHWGLSSNIDYLERIYLALKDSPAMGLNLDTGNYVGDPYPQFERLVGHANIIQAKTYYGGGHYYDLDLDYPRIGKIAREKGFKGYVSLEMEGKENPDIAVPKSLEVLRKAFNG
ncbi:sugar phosphate isomerase/epimerase family protein [Sphingobacterium wenxiniae]|uniref:Sugar phosphate isomerase/epimerase n=1 Tax=Sphingobacterium wenxiniae TaxID=683125 RepID=A0A1I6SQY1_9SPHI|nr:sugar phosphate isomerase/epimerase family protein [Sphingobacterium wenxiniae]SFS79381.1 Sugar phosphate isomerase/epimerase [Sphingobacterium wenxiniae]